MSATNVLSGANTPDMAQETRPVPVGAVSEQMVRLGSVVDNLATLSGALEGRLEPVLDRVEVKPGDPTDTPPEPGLAPMAEDLRALCLRLEDTFENLSALARRVSV